MNVYTIYHLSNGYPSDSETLRIRGIDVFTDYYTAVFSVTELYSVKVQGRVTRVQYGDTVQSLQYGDTVQPVGCSGEPWVFSVFMKCIILKLSRPVRMC